MNQNMMIHMRQIKVYQTISSISIITFAMTALAFVLVRESVKPFPDQKPIIRTGELPYNVPVLVYWIEDNGTVSAASAIRTNYAGVLPYSTSGKPVPYQNIEGFTSWQVLDAAVYGRGF